MRKLPDYPLWLGSAVDMHDLRTVLSEGIEAVVDLAMNEPVPLVTRDLVYCRFPLLDGAGNDSRVLRIALHTTAELLRRDVKTLVYCSAGMSRTPAVAAGALALGFGLTFESARSLVAANAPVDISPTLLSDIHRLLLPS